MLSKAIGIELELRQREVGVGAFSLDILAQDVDRQRVVIIENQLSRTDHDHLGKLITYAAGLNAMVAVWISPEFREEHRAAIDWLNENTDESKEFFAIQIEALQIDDSKPAPNFKLISHPNDWQKITKASAQQSTGNSERRAFFLDYFTQLSSSARQAGFPRAQAPYGGNYLVLDRLPGGADLTVAFSRELLNLGVYIERNDAADNSRIYNELVAAKDEIEREVGCSLTWDFKGDRARQQIWTVTNAAQNNPEELQKKPRMGNCNGAITKERVSSPLSQNQAVDLKGRQIGEGSLRHLMI